MINSFYPSMTHYTSCCWELVASSFFKVFEHENLILPNQPIEKADFPRAFTTPGPSSNRAVQTPIIKKVIKRFQLECHVHREWPPLLVSVASSNWIKLVPNYPRIRAFWERSFIEQVYQVPQCSPMILEVSKHIWPQKHWYPTVNPLIPPKKSFITKMNNLIDTPP